MMTNHSLSHKPASQLAIERERANRVTGRGAATVFAVSSTQPFAAWRFCVKEQCARTPVRAFNTALFHQGLLWNQKFSDQWSQQLGADVQVFREPNQIQLVCTTAGVVFIVQPPRTRAVWSDDRRGKRDDNIGRRDLRC